ncbi:MAG: phage virion morphogenesis protein [Candidatus Carbobacillus sp.]|nr:phage virion morphogenesis protein [Candidatus Carbobacillus sp.]
MLTINFEQFASEIKRNSKQLEHLMNVQLPKIIGREAVKHFKKNFQTQSWKRTKWTEVKRRQDWTRQYKYSKPAARSRKILTGSTGDLGRSIQYSTETGKVTIHSDLIYAAVHNYGLRAGRGSGFTMPQRQFIGNDPELIKHIEKIINKRLQQIFEA